MSSWRERLCGSIALNAASEAEIPPLHQFTNPSQSISCGGGFFPVNKNVANMKTHKANFVLPTKAYSVLIFKEDGSAVIYSDDATAQVKDDSENEEAADQ